MGKISDIWVRLGLKKDDFDKGMDDAAKKTEGVGGAFGKMKAAALAVWAAIGTAAVKFAQDLIASTNRMGDAWAVFTSQSKAAWDTFLSAVSAWDFSNFFGRMREATAQAAEFAKALDSEFEANNSIRLQRAAMSEELAALKILYQDQTKTYDERAKAAQDYIDKVSPIYDQIIAQAKKMEDAHLGKWLAGSGLGDTEQVRQDLRKFLVEIGKNDELANNLAYLVENRERYTMTLSNLSRGNLADRARGPLEAFKREYEAMQAWAREFGASAGYGTSLYDLASVYTNMRGDKDTGPLVEAMVRAYEAAGLKGKELQEVYSALNGFVAQQTAAALKAAADEAANSPEALLDKTLDDIIANIEDEIEDTEIEFPEIDLSALDAADEKLAAFVENWRAEQEKLAQYNAMLEDAIVSAMSNGLQAITDLMAGLEGADGKQVMAAFIAPFADTMKQMGAMIMSEGIAMTAFKKSFTNPAAAIAAGAALMAIGSAVSSGLQALTANPSGGTGYSSGASASAGVKNYESEMTIYVEGKISGTDIVLAGNKTLNNWRR